MTAYELMQAVRAQFLDNLKGPGVTWNLKGIEAQFDQAVATVALKHLEMK